MADLDNNLLLALRKYRPRESRDSLEDFVTEAFCWLLNNNNELSEKYLAFISEELVKVGKEFMLPHGSLNWKTQVNFNGFKPDVVLQVEDKAIIIEHKVGAHLHENQLSNYKDYANENFSDYRIILLTKNTSQHSQNPDLAFCWENVYTLIKNAISNDSSSSMENSFIGLLEHEGLGPKAPISHESIQYHYYAESLPSRLGDLFKDSITKCDSIAKPLIEEEEYNLKIESRWGRLGYEFHKKRSPGVFAGVMLENTDHSYLPIKGNDSPDFVFIISFDKELHDYYPNDTDYQGFIKSLTQSIHAKTDNSWEVYEHLEDTSVINPNRWHPLYIRKPLIDVLRGTITKEDQEDKILEAIDTIAPLVLNNPSFKAMKVKWSEKY